MLAQAVNAWSELDLAASRSGWDETYGHIVTNKENGVAERQNLVRHVKDFATAFKADPSTDRVEALLRYMKRFINSLYERVEVAEDGFLEVYQKIALIDDPAPILSEAQTELLAKVRRVSQLEADVSEAREALTASEAARAQAAEAAEEASNAQREAQTKREGSELVTEYERQVASLEHELRGSRRDRDALRRQVDELQEQLDELSSARQEMLDRADDGSMMDAVGSPTPGGDAGAAAFASVARRLTDERVARLQALLDEAQDDADRALAERRDLEQKLRTSEEAHCAAVSAMKAQHDGAIADLRAQAVQRSAAAAAAVDGDASESQPSTGARQHAGGTDNGRASGPVAHYAARVTELERALQRSHDDVATLRQQLREARAEELNKLASAMTIADTNESAGPVRASTVSAASGSTDKAGVHTSAAAAAAGSGGSSAGGFLSEADFSFLIGEDRRTTTTSSSATAAAAAVTASEHAPSDGTTSSSARLLSASASSSSVAEGGAANMTTALLKQRDSLKRQLSEAHSVVARLNAQLRAAAAPQSSGVVVAAVSGGSSGRGNGTSVIDIDPAGAAVSGAVRGRKRDAALSVLDRVGGMLGQMLQVNRAARIGVVLYLAALHLVVFFVVTSWSSAAMHHRTSIVAPKPSLANIGVTHAPKA